MSETAALVSEIRSLVAVVERAHDRQERDHDSSRGDIGEIRVALAELPARLLEATRHDRVELLTAVRAVAELVREEHRIGRHDLANKIVTTVTALGLDVRQYTDSGDRQLPETASAGGELVHVADRLLRRPRVRRALLTALIAGAGALLAHLPALLRLIMQGGW